MIVVDLDAAQFLAELFAEFGLLIGDGHQAGIGNALRQVARIDAAEPAESDYAYI